METNNFQEAFRCCEETENYGDPLVRISANGAEIIVISDLHLASGRMLDGRYAGTENFFADSSLYRFIYAMLSRLQGKRAILVINGDVVDFLRIIELPQSEQDFQNWQSLLQEVGIVKSVQELKGCFNNWKEKRFGLKTDDYKSIWKLDKCVRGHSRFFLALAEWIGAGNQIIISKGNHDLELYWGCVRNAFRLMLAKKLFGQLQKKDPGESLTNVLTQRIAPNLRFVDDAMVIDETFYIEHGHRYDKFTNVVGRPLLNKNELNIPFGSFFNRYILNQIELAYPYSDNVRPTQNVLPLLIRERFFVALKLMLWYVPFTVLMIPKRYFSYMFRQLALIVAIVVPFIIAVLYLVASMPKVAGHLQSLPGMNWPGSTLAKSFASLAASYFLGRIVAYLQLSEPSALDVPAMKIFVANPQYQLITMGHTHNPDQRLKDGRWFYNTGTWIPIVETDTAEIRDDQTYTFLHFRRRESGQLTPTVVERWDDEAARAEALIMVSDD